MPEEIAADERGRIYRRPAQPLNPESTLEQYDPLGHADLAKSARAAAESSGRNPAAWAESIPESSLDPHTRLLNTLTPTSNGYQPSHRHSQSVDPSYIGDLQYFKTDAVPSVSDSGYASQNPTAGPKYTHHASVPLFDIPSQNPCPARSTTSARSGQSSRALRGPQHSARRCSLCSKHLKNDSDARKHELTHTRPYRCEIPNCSNTKGFATNNDLQRHRHNVHGAAPTKGPTQIYVCHSCSQTPSSSARIKEWRRLDNFKSHIKRKHFNEDMLNLIERSKIEGQPEDAGSTVTGRSGDPESYLDTSEASEQHDAFSAPSVVAEAVYLPSQQHFQPTPFPVVEELTSNMGGGANLHMMAEYQPFTSMSELYITNPAQHLFIGPPADFDNSDFSMSNISMAGDQFPQISGHEFSTFEHSDAREPSDVSEQPADETRHHPHHPDGASSGFHCNECHKVYKRDCDLKKHMKRHIRPYGCTFPSCGKRVGSRSDWRRHETRRHVNLEVCKCACQPHDGGHCLRPFNENRGLNSHPAECPCDNTWIGPHNSGQFWCGFCVQLIPFTTPDDPLSSRFSHIGDHFDQQHCQIGDWICLPEGEAKNRLYPMGNPVVTVTDDDEDRKNQCLSEDQTSQYSLVGSFSILPVSPVLETMLSVPSPSPNTYTLDLSLPISQEESFDDPRAALVTQQHDSFVSNWSFQADTSFNGDDYGFSEEHSWS